MEAIAYADFLYAYEHPETLNPSHIKGKLASSGWIKLISTLFALSIMILATRAIAYSLAQGSTGAAVSNLQTQLKNQGYFPKNQRITGYYGSITTTAVKNYQIEVGLPADGVAGPATLAQLNVSHTQPQSVNQISCNILQRGDRCASVAQLQRQLQAKGYFPKNQAITGYYGAITEQAVKTFQVQHGLTPDGVAGVGTLAKLNNSVGVAPNITKPTKNRLCRRVTTPGMPLNVRQQPSISAGIVAKIPNKTNIQVKNRGSQGWVALANGGYVSSSYLKMCP